jgi:peptide/nickel transport system permease protein
MSQAEATRTLAERGKQAQAPVDRLGQEKSRWAILRSMPHLIKLCLLILILFALAAIAAPLLAPHDPSRQVLMARLQAPAGFEGGSIDHPLGTDQLGRDILSRAIFGARVSLGIGMIGMVIGALIGVTAGMIAGFRRGVLDEIIMFLVDAQLALPFIVMALIAIAIFGTDLLVLILVVGVAGWEGYARLTRGMVLSAREQQYVLSAEAAGASRKRIMARHILPNIAAPLIVLATFQLTSIILLESSLSFLGIGVQPPTASWGSMIGQGREYLNTAWWIAVVPGVAIVMTTMTISLIGDWLRDVLDPTLRAR